MEKRMHLSRVMPLRKLLEAHPNMPLLFYGGEYASDNCCRTVNARLGYVLNVKTPYDAAVGGDGLFMDKELFQDAIAENIMRTTTADEHLTVAEINRRAADVAKEYDEYWREVILVEVDA